MKSHRKELWFNIPSRRGFVNITREVETAIRESGVKEGLVLVNASLSHSHHHTYHVFGLLVISELRQIFDPQDYQS